eukprot:m.270643 g.270643  ORF g.270643 m.270643 type:complete len:175 (+) comp16265_c1_seq18:1086-1610(+)
MGCCSSSEKEDDGMPSERTRLLYDKGLPGDNPSINGPVVDAPYFDHPQHKREIWNDSCERKLRDVVRVFEESHISVHSADRIDTLSAAENKEREEEYSKVKFKPSKRLPSSIVRLSHVSDPKVAVQLLRAPVPTWEPGYTEFSEIFVQKFLNMGVEGQEEVITLFEDLGRQEET